VDSELEVIRDQMEETRASLADKLETLEAQVRETVQTASDTVETVKETVAATVENVKSTVDSVSDTVSTVTSNLDPRQYFESNPWAAFGAAVGVGFVGGLLAGGSSSPAQQSWQGGSTPTPTPAYTPAASAAPASSNSGQSSFGLGSLLSSSGPFGEVVDKLKGLAVGTLLGYVREMVSTSAPEMWKNDLTGMLDNITPQLGGQVIHHPDLKVNGPASSNEGNSGGDGGSRTQDWSSRGGASAYGRG